MNTRELEELISQLNQKVDAHLVRLLDRVFELEKKVSELERDHAKC